MAEHEFDVVIVGGGSAGCAAAGRLCATTDLHVCLVEAGPDYGPASEGYWPSELLDARVRPGTHDWGYGEEREDGTTVSEPRARVIGGCSAHNLCAALWGMPADYDAWAAAAPTRWLSRGARLRRPRKARYRGRARARPGRARLLRRRPPHAA